MSIALDEAKRALADPENPPVRPLSAEVLAMAATGGRRAFRQARRQLDFNSYPEEGE